jgi:hypothetical protein
VAQRFYKGRTNNHLTWVMVDATDFATPESALSAATKIKIYGKLRAAAGVNFVSSGTGSLTNDITHVGASVLGIYSIGLVKADLSDASAAWYDQYIISLSATGAAYQALVVEGMIDDSNLSGIISDILSAAVQINSRVLVAQSGASDAASAAQQANSRVLLNKSAISDIQSYLVAMSGIQSDIYSALSDLQSDFQSRVPKAVATNSQLSDLHSDLRSYLVVMSGAQSDVYSLLSDHHSDFQSRVPKLVATNSQLSDLASDVKSAVGAITVALTASDISDIASAVAAAATAITASDISDIASAVWAHAVGTRVDSRVLVIQSRVSDAQSMLSDFYSDFQSRVPKAVATNSQLSDLHSDLRSYLVVMSGVQSDLTSALSDLQSDFQSRVPKRVATDSQLSDVSSDLRSLIGAGVALNASALSDIDSLFGSRLSDIQSAATQANSRVLLTQSLASDAHSAAAAGASRILLAQSALSDVQSYLVAMSGVLSDVQSATVAIQAKTDVLPDGIKKNTQLANFMFLMVDSADHVTPKTGLTITATRSIDGAAFGACANAAAEVSAGWYKITLATTDLNGDVIALKFTSAGADARNITIVTQT